MHGILHTASCFIAVFAIVHGFRCYDNIAQTQNVSKCLYLLCVWLLYCCFVIFIFRFHWNHLSFWLGYIIALLTFLVMTHGVSMRLITSCSYVKMLRYSQMQTKFAIIDMSTRKNWTTWSVSFIWLFDNYWQTKEHLIHIFDIGQCNICCCKIYVCTYS